MTKFIAKIMFVLIFFCSVQQSFAHNYSGSEYPSAKEQDRIDKILNERLQLTKEQKDYLQKAKSKNRKEIEAAIKKMQLKHDEIARVYMLGLPKFQTDLRTASKKAELVILKQNADKIKERHRKDFESILTPEQKAEFEKIKAEHAAKKAQAQNNRTFR